MLHGHEFATEAYDDFILIITIKRLHRYQLQRVRFSSAQPNRERLVGNTASEISEMKIPTYFRFVGSKGKRGK